MFIFIQCKWKVKVTWNTYIMFYHVNVFVQLLRYCIEFLKFLSFSFFFVSYKYLSYTVYVRILLFSVTLFPAYSSVCKVCKSSQFPTSAQCKRHNFLSGGTQRHGFSSQVGIEHIIATFTARCCAAAPRWPQKFYLYSYEYLCTYISKF